LRALLSALLLTLGHGAGGACLLHLFLSPGLEFRLEAGLVGELLLLLPSVVAHVAVSGRAGQLLGHHQLCRHHHLLHVVRDDVAPEAPVLAAKISAKGTGIVGGRRSVRRRSVALCHRDHSIKGIVSECPGVDRRFSAVVIISHVVEEELLTQAARFEIVDRLGNCALKRGM
jgi:hypothetical protein